MRWLVTIPHWHRLFDLMNGYARTRSTSLNASLLQSLEQGLLMSPDPGSTLELMLDFGQWRGRITLYDAF